MSLIKCPTDGWWKHWFFITKINIYESPSKLELCKPSSWRNLTALLAAIVSNTTMDDGRGMISNRAAIIFQRSCEPRLWYLLLPILQKQHLQNCFQSTWVRWLPDRLLRGLFADRFTMLDLKLLKVLLYQIRKFAQWSHCLFNSALVSAIPYKQTNHDKKLRTSWALKCQPEKISKRE